MSEYKKDSSSPVIGVSLVDGDPAVRHARQLMLRSEDYDVRSYPTCAALLADPRSRDYPCIILDFEMEHLDGLDLLRQMRASGWRGKALLLGGASSSAATAQDAERHGDRVVPHDIGEQALLAAITASVDHSWAGWNAVG